MPWHNSEDPVRQPRTITRSLPSLRAIQVSAWGIKWVFPAVSVFDFPNRWSFDMWRSRTAMNKGWEYGVMQEGWSILSASLFIFSMALILPHFPLLNNPGLIS